MVVEMKRYEADYVCVKCKHALSYDEMMHSGAVCPYCGHTTSGTVCEITKIVREVEYTGIAKFFKLFFGV